jgi:Leucine-rich repeat (LRR) protein
MLSNNRFSRFPLGLHNVKSLQELYLCDNMIPLLPQRIDQMTFLTTLDLSKNQLKALPVEFTDVLVSYCVEIEVLRSFKIMYCAPMI